MKTWKILLIFIFFAGIMACNKPIQLEPPSDGLGAIHENLRWPGGAKIKLRLTMENKIIDDIDKTFSYAKKSLTKLQFENLRNTVDAKQKSIECKAADLDEHGVLYPWEDCSISKVEDTYYANIYISSSGWPFCHRRLFPGSSVYEIDWKECIDSEWKIWIEPQKDKSNLIDMTYDKNHYIKLICKQGVCSLVDEKGEKIKKIPVKYSVQKNAAGEKRYVERVKKEAREEELKRLQQEREEKAEAAQRAREARAEARAKEKARKLTACYQLDSFFYQVRGEEYMVPKETYEHSLRAWQDLNCSALIGEDYVKKAESQAKAIESIRRANGWY